MHAALTYNPKIIYKDDRTPNSIPIKDQGLCYSNSNWYILAYLQAYNLKWDLMLISI